MDKNAYHFFLNMIRENYAFLAPKLEQVRELFGEDWEEEFSYYVTRVFGPSAGKSWNDAVEGYAEFCVDAMRAQVYFERHGEYKANSYADCLKNCYRDAEYMLGQYLPGQFVAHFAWPHHYRMMKHYRETLLPKVRNEVHSFYEVGVGSGMYSLLTLLELEDAHGVGLDISDYSLGFAHKVVNGFGLGERYGIRNVDILKDSPSELVDYVVSHEVLEHLEDPEAFIEGLHGLVRPGGYAYITAAIKAAHTDHIYLYRTPDEVREHVTRAGWQVLDSSIAEADMEKQIEFRPTIVGYFCQKGK